MMKINNISFRIVTLATWNIMDNFSLISNRFPYLAKLMCSQKWLLQIEPYFAKNE
ncbi:hypothetical protein CLV32_4593 [Pedobacter duraquae]|uniref:Uncharacterized protein n=1 Tax=Pedobacter duraquae TaxID=425511 RepID=A0A4R6IAV8_9SPHI|nr:hypothetical protein CLV32_4593 [Pedobacter duraquae]